MKDDLEVTSTPLRAWRARYALLLLAACGAAPVAVAPTPTTATAQGERSAPSKATDAAASAPADDAHAPPLLHIDWSKVHLSSDADALALWQQIAPTGADWTLRLGELPNDDGLLKPLAKALLREGNFACPAQACAAAGLQEVRDDATLADPCLRRQLALWAIARLDDDDAPELADVLVALAGLPPPEDELVEAAFDLVPLGSDELLLRMNRAARAAGQGELADGSLQWLGPAALAEVIAHQHSDGVLALLDPAEHRPAFLAAVVDPRLRPKTRVEAMSQLTEAVLDNAKLPADLRRALRTAAADPSCEVAAAAAYQLGEGRYAPRPQTTTVAAALRSLCVAAAYEDELPSATTLDLRRFMSREGLQIIDHVELADEGSTSGELILHEDALYLPFGAELTDALEHCEGTVCRAHGLRFELTLDSRRLLRRIERFAEPTIACGDADV